MPTGEFNAGSWSRARWLTGSDEEREAMSKAAIMINSLDAVVKRVLADYDFSPSTTISLANVSENTTYRVDDPNTGRSAALRIHRPDYHSKDEIESELFWMDDLRNAGVVRPPVAIAARDGSRVQTVNVEGSQPRHAVVFEWLPGKAPSTNGDLVPSFRVLGSLAAKMHLHGASWTPPDKFRRYSCNYDAALGPKAMWGRWQDGLGIGPSEFGILSRLDAEIKRRMAEYGESPDRFGLAHNDLRLANLLVDGDSLYVIDFDDCGSACYMYDFATAVSFIEDDPRVSDWMVSWLDGYVSQRSLTTSDFDIIPTLVLFRRLLLLGWVGSHYDYAQEARDLGVEYTTITCRLAEQYLTGRYLR